MHSVHLPPYSRRGTTSADDIFAACSPRADVLDGVLSDAVFAASLDEVVGGTAPDVYGDADTFSAATHPSEGRLDSCGSTGSSGDADVMDTAPIRHGREKYR